MSIFNDFEDEYGPPENCVSVEPRRSKPYQGRLPPELLEAWHENGWCSWGDGLLWVTDPEQLSDVLEDWPQPEAKGGLVFLRTAFAHLYFWRDGWVYSLDVQHGSLSQVTRKISRMFTLLCDPEIKERILRVSLYRKAVQQIGRPRIDECFAFEPALALGGGGELHTVRKVKIREQLGILAQLAS